MKYSHLDIRPTIARPLVSNRLADRVSQVFVIAYKEPTELLEKALIREGFTCQVLRQEPNPAFKGFSPSYLCLLNHRRAWEQAIRTSRPVLVVEADFVPVIGMGSLPLPFNSTQPDVGIAWLYTCAPQIYSISPEGYAQGYSASTVAYIVTPQGARCLLELADEIRTTVGPTAYSSWDSTIDNFLRRHKLKNYIPFRNYGEHGGKPNPEHRHNGLSASHRADVLYGKLAFSPLYATIQGTTPLTFPLARLMARYKGIARLASGRFLRFKILRNSSVPGRLLKFAIGRHLSMW